jgi:hypothetical protein
MTRPTTVAALAALGLTACASEPNLGEYATDEIEAVLKVQNTEAGNTAAFEVILLGPQTGLSPNYIKLTEEAALTATWGDSSAELEQVTQGVISYGADVTTTEATEFNIAFTRPDGEDAPTNTIWLAAPFEITSVSSSVGPGGTLDIAWSGGSEGVELTVSGDCIQQYNSTVPMADGGVEIPFESLAPVDADNPTSCALSTQLHSENLGAADPAWAQDSSTVGRVLRKKEGATVYQP